MNAPGENSPPMLDPLNWPDLFDSLQAENETWLPKHGWIDYPDFYLLKGSQSKIVYGPPGSGKSATYRALEQEACHRPGLLVAHWLPRLPADQQADTLGRIFYEQALNECARSLAAALGPRQVAFDQSEDWVQESLVSFLRLYFPGWERELPRIRGSGWLQTRLAESQTQIFGQGLSVVEIMKEVLEAMHWIDLHGFWILVDRVEAVAALEPERLIAALHAFLDKLAYFENPRFSFKFMLPLSLEPGLRDVLSTERLRVGVQFIDWDEQLLEEMVQKRVALAVGNPDFRLQDLYSREALLSWLKNCGGDSPRAWLEYIRPVVAEFMSLRSRGITRSLNKQEWLSSRKRSSLMLTLDPQTGYVSVGWRQVQNLSVEDLAILRFLYENEGRVCSKEEIYKKAYLPLQSLQQDIGVSIVKSDYEDLLNTALHRLRDAVEPDKKNWVFIQTVTGKGISFHRRAADSSVK